MSSTRTRLLIGFMLLAFTAGLIGAITACGHSQTPRPQSAASDNSDLRKLPQYSASLQMLEKHYQFYVPEISSGAAYFSQCKVDAMLFLRAMATSPSARPPYLYSAVVDTRSAAKVRLISLKWIGIDHSIPKFEVIGRGGRVVGSFQGAATNDYSPGDDDDWFRVLLVFPVLKGEDEEKASHAFFYLSSMPKIHLDINGMNEIEGVRFIPDDHSLPRFVSVHFGDEEIFRAAAATQRAMHSLDERPAQPGGWIPGPKQ